MVWLYPGVYKKTQISLLINQTMVKFGAETQLGVFYFLRNRKIICTTADWNLIDGDFWKKKT